MVSNSKPLYSTGRESVKRGLGVPGAGHGDLQKFAEEEVVWLFQVPAGVHIVVFVLRFQRWSWVISGCVDCEAK
jgi:hypothetical protein